MILSPDGRTGKCCQNGFGHHPKADGGERLLTCRLQALFKTLGACHCSSINNLTGTLWHDRKEKKRTVFAFSAIITGASWGSSQEPLRRDQFTYVVRSSCSTYTHLMLLLMTVFALWWLSDSSYLACTSISTAQKASQGNTLLTLLRIHAFEVKRCELGKADVLKDGILRDGKDGMQYDEHDLKDGMQYCEYVALSWAPGSALWDCLSTSCFRSCSMICTCLLEIPARRDQLLCVDRLKLFGITDAF